jgi:hypothetical protein
MLAIEQALRTLENHPDWLTYGLIDGVFLAEQMEQFRQGDDPNTEHYRYAAFKRILQSHTSLDDTTLTRYVELTRLDPDTTMGQAAFIDLLWWKGLTEAQFTWLEERPAFPTPVTQRVLARVRRQRAQH